METNIKDMQLNTIDYGTLEANFSVPYHYEIRFTNHLFGIDNSLVKDFFESKYIREGQKPKVLFMIDRGVVNQHPELQSNIREYFSRISTVELIENIYIFPGGEQVKNDSLAQKRMLNAIDIHGIDRHSYVIAIGGGAILDAVGFTAAISHRGVRHIRIPTTVLSQNDSGIGVKNGINYFGKKNYLGSFTPPVAVWNDLHFLNTLSSRDKRSGLAEAVKVALIKDSSFFNWLEENSEELKRFDEKIVQLSIYTCARLHLNHITNGGDPFERGSARPLDFGHWAAHKLEDLTGYKIRHGEAVATGIAIDSVYSNLMGFLDHQSLNRILNLFIGLGFDSSQVYLNGFDIEQLLEGLEEFREHLGGQLTITLLGGIGKGFEVHEINTSKMKEAFDFLHQQMASNEN